MKSRSAWLRRSVLALLFAALVLILLWFQGVLWRDGQPAAPVPEPVRVAAGARTARVERRVVAALHVYPGFVEAIDPAAVAPRVMSTVLAVAGREGDAVQQGQIVVELDDRDARAQLSQAEAGLEAAAAQSLQARLAFERAQRLHEVGALTTQEWESARAAQDGTRAQQERARQAVEQAKAALTWFQLAAPFDGRILARHSDPGDLATQGRPILSLYREDRLRFRVAVPEEHAADLTAGGELELDFDRLPSRRASLLRVLPSADPRTGTVTLHLSLSPSDDLRPGLMGKLRLAVGQREALLVPLSAVERIGQVERVDLVRDGAIVPITVRTGRQHGDAVEVLSGLASGEEVLLP